MEREDILYLTKNYRDSFVQIIKAKHRDFYNEIINTFMGKSASEKLYRYCYKDNIDLGKCGLCKKNDTRFYSFSIGFGKFCSKSCANISSIPQRSVSGPRDLKYWIEKKCERCGKDFWSWIKRDARFCSNQCCAETTANSPKRLLKIRKTKLKRYNNETYVNPNKAKKTCLEKYGVDNASKSSGIIEKIKKENKNKFYEKLITNHKLNDATEVLFTKDEYINSDKKNKYKFRCKKCNDIFEYHIAGGHVPRCWKCYPRMITFSNDEKDILSYVKSLLSNENVIENDRGVLKNRELDIYIPALKIAIEYDGLFWHSEISGNKNRNYHLDKLNRCNDAGVRLITIFEDEWVNKQDIVKSRISHILNKTISKIYARKCEIRNISSEQSNKFLEKQHIQGGCNAKVKLGLFYNNDLVAVMTFGSMRISLGSNPLVLNKYELIRYATSSSIVGGASKLFSYFIKTYSPRSIISYADRRWSMGNMYNTLGFINKGYTDPNYWYFVSGGVNRHHRFGFRKNVLKDKLLLFDPELTEWENMQLNGYDRIWDCGSVKYEWKRL